MNKYNALKFNQDDQEYFITVLPFEVINDISRTLVYGEDEPYGYQRNLNPVHYKKIFKSIKNTNELISPTSIVLGINKSDFNLIDKEQLNENIYSLFIDNYDESPFRIIDGQHRLKGLELATEENPRLLDYQLSVIIMIINDNNRRREVQVFNNINSKAKPLKMDLTILALYKYDLLEMVKEFDVKQHVAIRVAHVLNEDSESVWKNAIRLDVNNSNSMGIIGFKTFYESIKPICEQFIRDEYEFESLSFEEKLKSVNYISEVIAKELLIPSWKLVKNKWPECFNKAIVFSNLEELTTLYNKSYYIQRPMGAKAINGLIDHYFRETNLDYNYTLSEFKKRILESSLTFESWKVGGQFSGLSSEAGFKKIRELI